MIKMVFTRNKIGLQLNALRHPKPPIVSVPSRWFIANVNFKPGSYSMPSPILSMSDKYKNCNLALLHNYNIRDANKHPNIVKQTLDGHYITGVKLTHDCKNELLGTENIFLGPMGKDKNNSYLNAHNQYELDSKLSAITRIKEIPGKKDQLTTEQLKIINDVMDNPPGMLFNLPYEQKYRDPRTSFSVETENFEKNVPAEDSIKLNDSHKTMIPKSKTLTKNNNKIPYDNNNEVD